MSVCQSMYVCISAPFSSSTTVHVIHLPPSGWTPHPVGVVVDVHVKVLVHGGEGGAMLQVVGGQPAVHHVVVEGVEQLDVHVAHQSVQDLLQGERAQRG